MGTTKGAAPSGIKSTDLRVGATVSILTGYTVSKSGSSGEYHDPAKKPKSDHKFRVERASDASATLVRVKKGGDGEKARITHSKNRNTVFGVS